MFAFPPRFPAGGLQPWGGGQSRILGQLWHVLAVSVTAGLSGPLRVLHPVSPCGCVCVWGGGVLHINKQFYNSTRFDTVYQETASDATN